MSGFERLIVKDIGEEIRDPSMVWRPVKLSIEADVPTGDPIGARAKIEVSIPVPTSSGMTIEAIEDEARRAALEYLKQAIQVASSQS